MHDGMLIAAGSLTLLAAAIHGIVGQRLVVRVLTEDRLFPTLFGGARMTRAMIGVSWHLTTVGFLAAGGALIAGAALSDEAPARAAAIAGAIQVTACAAVIVALGAVLTGTPRAFLRHPAPVLVTTTAVLAWLGAT